ncbi:class I SAM-dependent methyltransferase [Methanobrevibacter filiformis]|uniref:Trans-aconitate 2-methyltransferase n=1 Tax=Methanobrevibacter filiformis TaxID=55758 RepID=A0A166D2D1_9EURY|nr:class I SAM-dependent methyltransferase [Methanobrevibacter filiformis]KZX15133.1 trans-aconitate 2-methyltransferase [Methanobrevibacter filiformis]
MIKISYDINVYRDILNDTLKTTDTIVELGCHVGKSTELIANKVINGKIISIDNSPEAIDAMGNLSEEYDNLHFISGDVRIHNVLEEAVKLVSSCDVLSIDLGGGYHPDTVFKVYYIWSSALRPRDTIIRNRGLIDFVRSSKTYEEIESDNGWLKSCYGQGIPPQIKEFSLWTDKLNNK